MSGRIERVEPLGPRSLRVRLHLEDAEPLEVALEALERHGLGVGDALTGARRRELLALDAEVRVREAALTLISYRARTRRELDRRLRQKGFEPPRVEACLDRLEARGLLDDSAVAAAFVRDRLRHRPRGRSRLFSELRAKGVAADVVEEVVETVFEEEEIDDLSLGREVAEGWVARQAHDVLEALGAGARTPERTRARRRLGGYLSRRGFRGEALQAAVERAEELARASLAG